MAPPNKPLIIYGALPSGNSQKALLLAQFLSIPFEFRPPPPVGNWGTAETDEEHSTVNAFLAYNPRGLVPVLIDPNVEPDAGSGCSEGLVIADSAAIVTYLVRAYAGDDGKALWLPDDPVQSARVAQWMSYASAEVNSTLLKVRIHNLFSWSISPTTIDEAVESSKKVMAFLDSHLANGCTWLAGGDHPTVADVCVYPYVAFAEQSGMGSLSFELYPALQKWLAAFRSIPGYVEFPGLWNICNEDG